MVSEIERGRFEGIVLQKLENIEGVVGELKDAVAEQAEEIGSIRQAQAVHTEEHKHLCEAVKNGNGGCNGHTKLTDNLRLVIPTGVVVAALYCLAEILSAVLH